MNTDLDHTRAIGHLDPTRPPFGALFEDYQLPDTFRYEQYSPTWYGTTHELLMNVNKRVVPEANYIDAADLRKSECAVITGWLKTARIEHAVLSSRGLVNWDSGEYVDNSGNQKPNLTPIRLSPENPEDHIESQIRQTLFFGGIKAITGANDPFWNVRAFDTAMAKHNGYISYPLMCTIFQFVMDDITGNKKAP